MSDSNEVHSQQYKKTKGRKRIRINYQEIIDKEVSYRSDDLIKYDQVLIENDKVNPKDEQQTESFHSQQTNHEDNHIQLKRKSKNKIKIKNTADNDQGPMPDVHDNLTSQLQTIIKQSHRPALPTKTYHTKNSKPKDVPQSSSSHWRFPVDYNDHFETPMIAYEHLLPFIDQICLHLSKSREDLIIYDPYYCQGQMIEHLRQHGFVHIINHNRDFYQDIVTHNIPEYDVLITNPPYSGDHKQRLLSYLHSSASHQIRPFALLLPVYTSVKSYWKNFNEEMKSWRSSCSDCIYLLPPQYYHYHHPDNTGKDIPPFYSAWFVGGFHSSMKQRCLQSYDQLKIRSSHLMPGAQGNDKQLLVPQVPHLIATDQVTEIVRRQLVVEKRPNPKQRKKRKMSR